MHTQCDDHLGHEQTAREKTNPIRNARSVVQPAHISHTCLESALLLVAPHTEDVDDIDCRSAVAALCTVVDLCTHALVLGTLWVHDADLAPERLQLLVGIVTVEDARSLCGDGWCGWEWE